MNGSNVGYATAFAGGVISFLSPCVLPLVPVYLSMLAGVSVAELRDGSVRLKLRVVGDTALFVGGFSAVFVALGVSATALGSALIENKTVIERIAGVVMVVMAAFLLAVQWSSSARLQSEHRFAPSLARFGRIAPLVAGAAFGFGWTPCIGPVLTGVLAVAATQDRALRGGTLLAAYAAGLGVPFLFTGLAFGSVVGFLVKVRKHMRIFSIGAALVMFALGLLLATGNFTLLTSWTTRALGWLGLEELLRLG